MPRVSVDLPEFRLTVSSKSAWATEIDPAGTVLQLCWHAHLPKHSYEFVRRRSKQLLRSYEKHSSLYLQRWRRRSGRISRVDIPSRSNPSRSNQAQQTAQQQKSPLQHILCVCRASVAKPPRKYVRIQRQRTCRVNSSASSPQQRERRQSTQVVTHALLSHA